MDSKFIRDYKRHVLFFCTIFAFLLTCACKRAQHEIVDLKVEFISNIDSRPVFSWKTMSHEFDFSQSACRVLISDNQTDLENNIGNVWDSEKVKTQTNSQLKYIGNSLQNGNRYYVKVKIWDDAGSTSNWSAPVSFHVPIEYPQDWKASWITYDYHPDSALPIFKKILEANDKENIKSARLYIAAPGFYEAFLNGVKIGRNVLDPGQTNYEDYTYYSAYDLDLDAVRNNGALSVMLGNGWYNQNLVWGKGMIYGPPVFMAQIVIQYENGEKQTIGTDESWMWINGPITFSNIYAGESYDANLEVEDWAKTGNANSKWSRALLAENHPVNLLEQFSEPVQVMHSLDAKGIISKGDGRYIFDFGQNFAGWVRLQIKGKKGQEITIRCVEELDENGEIDPRTTGVRATRVIQTQEYTCKGEGTEIWEPKFTYFGFRYAEVEGLTEPAKKDLLKGIVVHSALPESGNFSCSEENINKLQELCLWTLKSNIIGIPTDCPHREKCGWTGDAHALAQMLIYNYDAQSFLSKYMLDMRSSARNTNKELYFGEDFHDRSVIDKPKGVPTMIAPGKRTSGTASPDWGTAMVQLPWYLYLYYGDTLMLHNFYPDMKLWVDYIQAKNNDGIIKHGLGDWCPPGGNGNIDCPVPVSSTAFHVLDLMLMAQIAKVLGVEADFNYYSKLHQETVESFNSHFLDNENFTYGSQTADAMALEIGIVPENLKKKVAASIVKNINERHNGFINTGIFGIARIFSALAENGFEDEVYKLLTKKGEHSFAYMWEHYDATTLWEILPVYTLVGEEMAFRSHNHPMQAGFADWFYSGIAGINPSPDKAGFKKIIFKPRLTNYLEEATGSYESVYGTIESSWKNEGGEFVWEVLIPENSTGEVFIPNYGEKVDVTVNGDVIHISDCTAEFTSIGEFGSGKYTIRLPRRTLESNPTKPDSINN